MKLYIYNYLDGITSNYHDGGGLVICTDHDPNVVWKEMAEHGVETKELPAPDRVLVVPADTEPFYEIFPDTGCC